MGLADSPTRRLSCSRTSFLILAARHRPSLRLVCVPNPFRSLFTQIAAKPDGQTVAMSTSSLRRQVKNIVHNYSEAEIKVACSSAHVDFAHPRCHVCDLKAAPASCSIRNVLRLLIKPYLFFPTPPLLPSSPPVIKAPYLMESDLCYFGACAPPSTLHPRA